MPYFRRPSWLHLPGSLWYRVERRIAEAPFETPIAVWFGIVGWLGVLNGEGFAPPSLEAALPILLVQAWTVGMALGGTLTAIGKMREHDRIEMGGLALLLWGVILYAGTVIVSVGTGGVTAAAAFFAIGLGAWIRLRVLRRRTKARKIAGDVLRSIKGRES
jgi:hypothetical protein